MSDNRIIVPDNTYRHAEYRHHLDEDAPPGRFGVGSLEASINITTHELQRWAASEIITDTEAEEARIALLPIVVDKLQRSLTDELGYVPTQTLTILSDVDWEIRPKWFELHRWLHWRSHSNWRSKHGTRITMTTVGAWVPGVGPVEKQQIGSFRDERRSR